MSARRLVAGVDSSTQSCTVELRDAATGALAGRGSAPHPPTSPPVSEQHPDVWWSALRAALAAALGSVDGGAGAPASAVRAVAVTAQCHGLVLLDGEHRALRAAKLWNDTTSGPQARAMVEALGVAGWGRRVGLRPSAALTVTKLAWVAEHEPELLARTAAFCVPHDLLTLRLTGRHVTDRSDASGTGVYGLDGTWQTDLLERFVGPAPAASDGWADAAPEVLGPDAPAGPVCAEAAAWLGLDGDVLVGAGGGDQHLGAVGLGLRPHDLGVSLGTSGVVMTTSALPVADETGWVDSVADATGGYLPLVCTLNATKVTDRFADLLGVDVEGLGALALAADATAPRPVLLAYLDGERSPARPGTQGLLGGLTGGTTRAGTALAAVEGVVFGLARGVEALVGAGLDVGGEVVVAGGGARATAYLQVLADVLGREVTTRETTDASARGACVQAAAVLAGVPVTQVRDAWTPPTGTRVAPRPGLASAVAAQRARYDALAALDDAVLTG